jgi:Holliday junction resolvasome RuvABC endonuclease subunit
VLQTTNVIRRATLSKQYVGIDLSLNGTAVVRVDDNGKILSQLRIKTKPVDMIEDRLISICKQVIESIENNSHIERVYIEGLSYSSSGQSTMELAGLHYVVRCAIHHSTFYDFKLIAPPSLKKFISGVGNCKKNLMLLYAFKKFGEEFDDDNICDAYCLARLALDEHKRGLPAVNTPIVKGKKKQRFLNNGNGHNHFRGKGGETINGKS